MDNLTNFSPINIQPIVPNFSHYIAQENQKINQITEIMAEANHRKAESENATIRLAEQNEEQLGLLHQQVDAVTQQNKLLQQNYDKLKDLYDVQAANYKDAKDDLTRTKKNNIILMIISIISMLGAIASPIVSCIVFALQAH